MVDRDEDRSRGRRIRYQRRGLRVSRRAPSIPRRQRSHRRFRSSGRSAVRSRCHECGGGARGRSGAERPASIQGQDPGHARNGGGLAPRSFASARRGPFGWRLWDGRLRRHHHPRRRRAGLAHRSSQAVDLDRSRGRRVRLCRLDGRDHDAFRRRRGGGEPDQPADLHQRRRRNRRHGAGNPAGVRRRKAARRSFDVRQHHCLHRSGARIAGRAPAGRFWSFTPPEPAAKRCSGWRPRGSWQACSI